MIKTESRRYRLPPGIYFFFKTFLYDVSVLLNRSDELFGAPLQFARVPLALPLPAPTARIRMKTTKSSCFQTFANGITRIPETQAHVLSAVTLVRVVFLNVRVVHEIRFAPNGIRVLARGDASDASRQTGRERVTGGGGGGGDGKQN